MNFFCTKYAKNWTSQETKSRMLHVNPYGQTRGQFSYVNMDKESNLVKNF